MELNIRRALIQALGNTPHIDEVIVKTYNTRSKEYYKAFRKEGGFYEDVFFDLYPSSRYNILEKVAGIVEYAYDHNQFLELYSIIKKAYPAVYKLVMNNSVITQAAWQKAIYQNKKIQEVSELELNNHMVAFVYLIIKEQEKGRTFQVQALTNIKEFIRDFNNLQLDGLKMYTMQKSFPHQNLPLMPSLEELKKISHINNYFEEIIQNESNDAFFNGKDPLTLDASKRDIDIARSKTFSLGKDASLIGFYSSFLKKYGMFENFFNVSVDMQDINGLQEYFDLIYTKNNLPHRKEEYLYPLLLMIGMSKEIEYLKPLVKTQSVEYMDFEYHLRHKNELEKLNSEKLALEEELNEAKKEKSNLNKRMKEAEVQLTKKDKELQRANKANEELKSKQESLYAMEQFIFQLEDELPVVSQAEQQKIEEILKSKDIVVVGGHESWVEKMKERFPSFSYLTVEGATNRALKGMKFDYLVFNVQKNSHGAYYRLKEVVSASKFIYVNKANIERCIHEIYSQIKR